MIVIRGYYALYFYKRAKGLRVMPKLRTRGRANPDAPTSIARTSQHIRERRPLHYLGRFHPADCEPSHMQGKYVFDRFIRELSGGVIDWEGAHSDHDVD